MAAVCAKHHKAETPLPGEPVGSPGGAFLRHIPGAGHLAAGPLLVGPAGAAARRTANFLLCAKGELATFARITGHRDVHQLCAEDLCTISREISEYTDIPHA